METQYILIRQNKSDAKKIRIQSEVKSVLKEASFVIKNNIIYFSEDDKENYVNFLMSHEDNNVLYLKVSTSLNGEAAAKLLDEFNERFVKGEHRRKFYIINAYSDASQFYCKKLTPVIGRFERLLREFIYLTLTGAYGREWIKIIDSERRKHIAEISKGKISHDIKYIEESLEWLDFSDIEEVLFTPCIYEDVDAVVTELLSTKEITKEEMLNKLKTIEKKSLWEREFQSFSDVKNLQENFNDIRNIRNTVMHNKFISHKYFEESLTKIEKINNQLRRAIRKIEKNIYDNTKEKSSIVIDIGAWTEACLKALKNSEDAKRKTEIGRRVAEKYSNLYGSTKVSDLTNAQLLINDAITKKINNG